MLSGIITVSKCQFRQKIWLVKKAKWDPGLPHVEQPRSGNQLEKFENQLEKFDR